MKYLIIIALLFSMQVSKNAAAAPFSPTQNPIAGQPQSCPVSSAETLVCSVVICNPIGLAIAKSRSKCLQVNRKFAIYLATLGFWSKPPSCKSRDQNCNKTGKASTANISTSECSKLNTTYEQQSCRAAVTGQVTKSFCNKLSGYRKTQCLAKLPPPPPPLTPINCGIKFVKDKYKVSLGSCLNYCSQNPNKCVIRHSDIDCYNGFRGSRNDQLMCIRECGRYNMCK